MPPRPHTWRLVVVWLALAPLPVAAQAPGGVQLFGHRGFTRAAPENSMAALEAAAALGLAGAEIDLRTTRDGHVVLMHDDTVNRTTTGTGAVAAMTLEEIRRLRLRLPDGHDTSEQVPDLDLVLAFLQRRPGFRIAFDTKAIDVGTVGRKVVDAGVMDRVIFFVDDLKDVERAKAVKRTDPRLYLSINLRSWWWIEGVAEFARAALDADALFAHEFYFPRFGFQEGVRSGAQIQVYVPGVDRLVERVQHAIQAGATLISSDRPDLLLPLAAPAR